SDLKDFACEVRFADTGVVDTTLDEIDLGLLEALQADARLPQSALGARVGLWTAAVNRRLKRLIEAGIILGSTLTLAPELLGRPVRVIAQLAVESEQVDRLDEVRDSLVDRPEVQQCYYVAGEWDFVVILLVKDMAEYTELTRKLFFGNDNVRRFSTQVVMDAAKVGLTLRLRCPARGRPPQAGHRSRSAAISSSARPSGRACSHGTAPWTSRAARRCPSRGRHRSGGSHRGR